MSLFRSIINTFLFHAGSLLGLIIRCDYVAKARNGKRVSEKTLLRILKANRNTEYGKKNHFSEIRSSADYKTRIPLSTYEDYKGYIEQTRENGTQNLITSKHISFFATTSGTTSIQKFIPQSYLTLIVFFKCICIFLNQCRNTLRARKVSSFNVRGFLITEVSSSFQKNKDGTISTGIISGYAAQGMKLFLPIFTQLPKEIIGCGEITDKEYVKSRYALQSKDLKFIVAPFMSSVTYSVSYIEKNHEMLIDDIEKGKINLGIEMSDAIRTKLESKLKPDPERAEELRRIFSTDSDIPLLNRIWPDLSFIVAIGSADFTPFTKTIRTLCKEDVDICYSLYACSESLIACAIYPSKPKYLPIIDSAFYEFIPIDSTETDKVLNICELEEGKLYEIILTNSTGLYRYQLKDVIKVVGFEGETPLIEFAYRSNFVTDLCGAHITGEHLSSSVKDLERDYDVLATDYSIYANTDYKGPHLELFIEFNKDIDKQTIEDMSVSFEKYMSNYAWDYKDFRKVNIIRPAVVHVVKRGSYFDYRSNEISKGASSNQLKAIRLIDNDKKLSFFRNRIL